MQNAPLLAKATIIVFGGAALLFTQPSESLATSAQARGSCISACCVCLEDESCENLTQQQVDAICLSNCGATAGGMCDGDAGPDCHGAHLICSV